MNLYLIFKSFHIFFMVAWFAGIFYLPRLFVNHIEASNEDIKNQLLGMERRLIRFITPLGILSVVFGLLMAYLSGNFLNFLSQDWIMLKISIVFGLIWYQLFCYQIINKLECNSLEWSSFKMRLFNELPVLFLIIGIFAAVYKF